MLINTTGWDFGTHTTWIEMNKSYIPVLDEHSNPVVFEVGENGIRMIPTVFFFDYDPPYQGQDGGVLMVGDDMLFYGTATRNSNSTMDIAINDKVVKTNILIQESGSFVDTLPTYNLTPGFKDIEAFIDTHFALGEDVTGIESNGSSNVFLKSNESILSLYCGTVIIGDDLTIHGTATGGTSLDIAIEDEVVAIDVPIAEDGEFEVTFPTPATPHTDTMGVKEIKAFIDTSFTVSENASKAESSGESSVFLVEGVGAGEIGVFAEENESVELKIVRISVVGTAGHNITVDSSDHTHTIFPWGMLDNPFAPSLPFNHIIDEDGIRGYAVRFNETGTYTITITDIDTSNTDSVDILVEARKVIFEMVDNCTIGDLLIVKGTANTGTYVTVAVDDYVYPELDRLVIDANKQFLKYIDTAGIWGAATAFHVPDYHRLEAFIDRPKAPSYPDIITPTETDDGNTTVLLTNPTLSAYLSKYEVFKETGFRIFGIAPGAKSVDILTISPRGGNGTGLEGDIPLSPGTNVTGITYRTLSVSESDHGFMKMMLVDRDADSGTYAIIVTTPGPNATYDGVNNPRLLEGIVETYCGGNPEILASKTQEEIVGIVKNATINAPSSDDLLQELHLSVGERITSFDTGQPENPYPSIFGIHNGTITPNVTIEVSKLYIYPCPGTGGHSEYAAFFYQNGTLLAEAHWNGYKGDWHNITFNETFVLYKGETYNYTIKTGSYPQIHHTPALPTTNGWINCTSFVDANGKIYKDWIPAIRLE